MAKSSLILESLQGARSTERLRALTSMGWRKSVALFLLAAATLIALHTPLLRLPYFWDEAGYYIPAARDLLAGSLIPVSTPSSAHPPLVLAWVALAWRIFGPGLIVTRCVMLLLAAFSLVGFFRLAQAVSNTTVAAVSAALTAIYPVFFAQSSLAQIDLPAAGLTFWALEAYFQGRRLRMALWFSLAALAKETTILVPLALVLWELFGPALMRRNSASNVSQPILAGKRFSDRLRLLAQRPYLSLLSPMLALCTWYAYHYVRTGVVFGNEEFFRYNVSATLHPFRFVLALLLRIWQTTGYLGLYMLTLACFVAMKYPARWTSPEFERTREGSQKQEAESTNGLRPRIAIPIQFAFAAITVVYILTLSAIGGAVLARYMLPVVPLWILLCVSTIWRRLRAWKAVLAIAALVFIASLFLNPPYGFAPEDNLAYCDYVRLHQRAEAFLQAHYAHARVLTAWPASDELSRPFLGYVSKPLSVVKIEDFTAEQLLSAADARSEFDFALVFSTKYQPANPFFDRWRLWRGWKMRYFGYHVDLSPQAAASVLGGNLVYVERLRGQWVGIVQIDKIQEAKSQIRENRPSSTTSASLQSSRILP